MGWCEILPTCLPRFGGPTFTKHLVDQRIYDHSLIGSEVI